MSDTNQTHSIKGRGRPIVLTLDRLSAGPEPQPGTKRERVTKALPQGVTSGMLYRDILRIAAPTSVELALASLVSMVDLMMVGGLGTWAITAVGLTTQPKFVLMTFSMAMNVGATALVARAKGAGQQDKARSIMRQALLINLVLGVLFSVAGLVFSEAMVRFMGAHNQQVLAAGTAYLQIQMASFLFFALTATLTAVLRGIGDSRTAMLYNSVANLANIALNWLLIEGNLGFPRLEVAGASLATALSQVIAFVLAAIAITRRGNYLHLSLRDGFTPKWDECREIARIGLPAAMEQLMMRAGSIVFSRTVASLGALEFAAHNVCMNIQSLTMMNGQVFSVSATSLMGQSLGKRRPDMAQAYTSRCQKSGMAVAISLGVAFVLFGRGLAGLYTDDIQCIELCVMLLWIVAFIQPFQSSQFIIAGALRGAGDTKFVAKTTFFTVMLLRPALAIVAVRVLGLGLAGAWYALAIDQILRAAAIWARYHSGAWKRIQVRV